MLSSMRKSAGSWMIKILLGIIVLAFVFMGAGSFYSNRQSEVARVNGKPISIKEYQQTYQMIVQNLEQRFGSRLDQEMIERLNLRQQAIDRLIKKHLIMQVAEKNNLRLPDQVLANSIAGIQAFQSNGNFDPQRYKQVLSRSRLSPEAFEALQKENIITGMVENIVANAVPVSEDEARAWFNWKNTEVKIRYAKFSGKDFDNVSVSEKEVEQYFEKHKDSYKTEPKIKARYIRFAPENYLNKVQVTKAEINDYYHSNQSGFTTPETVEARHILLKVPEDADEKTVQEVRKKAAEIMEKASSGADFAELARKFSEGPSAADGGYIGTLEKNDAVKPFSDQAFSMQPGEISPPVRTRFGWHIIKAEDHTPASVKPIDEVKEKIRQKLALRKAKDIAYEKAYSVYNISFGGEDLIKNSKDLGLSLKTTGFFTKKQGPEGTENSPAFAKAAFSLPLKEISGVKEIGEDYFLIQPVEKQEPYVPELGSVIKEVRSEALREKKTQAARKAAQIFLEQVKTEKSFLEAAEKADIKASTTEFFKRKEPVPGIGQNARISSAAFSLRTDNPVSDSVISGGKDIFYVISLSARKEPDKSDFQAEKKAVLAELEPMKQRQAVEKWLSALRESSKIEISDQFSTNKPG
ncbi:MAG: SurA N-terminal domain-containing protein [Desulfobacteraceae bacterium]|nr:SurA N-terminal domain-containing protein [Desulfobacteraceae bacterium]